MEKTEQRWFGLLIAAALAFNIVTLSPLVPWQQWMIWSRPEPDQRVMIEIENYEMMLPPEGIEVRAGEYVEFAATSNDVTYGLGVFRQDGTMVFQMQVLPGHTNRMLWRFDSPGEYDVRSTEYSGPRHSEMFYPGVIRVSP